MNSFKDITFKKIYNNCVLSTLFHCFTIGDFYLLDYELFWDNNSIFLNNSAGIRCSVTFYDNFFVFLNQNQIIDHEIYGSIHNIPKEYLLDFEENILPFYKENGKLNISTYFWGDEKESYSLDDEETIETLCGNFSLLYKGDVHELVEYWSVYYEINDVRIVDLVLEIYKKIVNNKEVIISKQDKIFLQDKNKQYLMQCEKSLNSINVYFEK